MAGAGFLVVWSVVATVIGTVFATNAGGIVDMLIENANQSKILAGRPHEIHPFAAVFCRLIGGLFLVLGVVAFVVGVTHL